MDSTRMEKEVITAAQNLINKDSDIGALLFECSDLPPFAHSVQQAVHLPVFDFNTMIRYVYTSAVQHEYTGYM
ncbi:MAG: hypothetical protein ACOC39_00020 [Desulfovermiculus sp.]